MQVLDPYFPQCPVRNILARIGDKWTLLVLLALAGSEVPMRYKALRAAIPDITAKTLAQTLRNLEADGLVTRQVFAEVPPRVEYALTPRAHTLMPHLNALVAWGIDNLANITADRRRYYGEG
ncbi:MAG: helix-turn-helix transcriptional regulator [Alloprevotella sp.]|nr:helix-turn-helix transcriptional regulator [Alloprevotella sp.]